MVAQTLAWISSTAGAFGIVAGAFLLVAPGALHEGSRWRHWLLEADLAAVLDARRAIERPLYRHHRVFGAAVIAGALAWFATLWTLRDRFPVPGEYAGTVTLALCTLAAFALGIGVFLLIRPSALKRFEATANRWIEPLPSSGKGDASASYAVINRLVVRAPRFTGLLLLTAGLGCCTFSG